MTKAVVAKMTHAQAKARRSAIALALREGGKPLDVADRFGVSPSLVGKVACAIGLDLRGGKTKPGTINHAELLSLYTDPASIPGLAKKYGVTVHGIRYVLAKHGVEFRERDFAPEPTLAPHVLPRLRTVEPGPVYTDRDPCRCCGARGDIDCGHRHRPAVTFVPRSMVA